MYSYRTGSLGEFFTMRYQRHETRESGLTVVHFIGQTAAMPRFPEPLISTGGLHLPCEHQVEKANASRIDKSSHEDANPLEDPMADDLDDLVRGSISHWEQILQGKRPVRIMTTYTERRKAVEMHTDFGVILASDEPSTEFVGYYASTDEMHALDRIQDALLSLPEQIDDYPEDDVPPTGMYL